MKYLILLFSTILMCSSCSSLKYQIGQIEPKNVSEELKFENEDLILTYDFWGEGGRLYFEIYNKTDEPIFIDWEHSNFVFNGYSYDYFTNEESITSIGVYDDLLGRNYNGVLHRNGTEYSKQVISRQQKKAQVPPNSNLRTKVVGLDFPYLRSKNDTQNFNESNSPLDVRTYLGYALKKNLDDVEELEYIDNQFYIKSIKDIKNSEIKKFESRDRFYVVSKQKMRDSGKTWALVGFLTTVLIIWSAGER